MASSGNEAFDKNAAAKKNFLRKFGRRVGNVFTRKRTSRGEMEDVSAPVLLPSGPPGDSNVVINPLMGAGLPSASVYQPSKSHPISVSSNIRSKGGGGGLVTGTRLSGEIPTVSSAMSEESVSGSGLPPERCLSEGNLVDSSPPNKDQLGGFGGRIWRAVPGSMESLPKSLQTELATKIGSRGYSISEDEGLPHSPSDNAMEKTAKRARASSHDPSRPEDRLSTSLGPQTSNLSQSTRSLLSCDGSSDGEQFGVQSFELDFNALRRAESLDNTAAKHRIQVSRPRKARPAGNLGGGLRKHKSMSTVQLSEISEEAVPDEPLRRRAPSSDLLMTKTNFSPAASQLTQELAQMQQKKDKKKEEEPEAKPKRDSTPPSPAPLAASRVVKPSSAGDSKVTKLRSMFGPSTSIDSPSEPVKSPTKPKPSSAEPKPQIFFSATTSSNKGFAKGFGVSGPPSSSPAKPSDPPRPKPIVPRPTSVPEPQKAPVRKVSADAVKPSVFKISSGNTPSSPTTDKNIASSKKGPEICAKKPVKDILRPAAKKKDEENGSGRPVSKVKDLVKNFQRLQETTSG